MPGPPPLANLDAAGYYERKTGNAAVAGKGVGIMGEKVLLIEDEPAIADTITYALGTEGFEWRWCATGAEGLEALEQAAHDLIILDVGLPDCNGFELCKRIRDRYELPIIFLTARSEEVDRVVGLEIGGDDYVVKPFSPRELAARVRAVLRRSGAGAKRAEIREEARPAGPKANPWFTVDEGRCLVRFKGRDLELARYEFRLLCILVRRPGWVFSREKLMEMAWDEPESSTDRTVDAHIKSIRAKLRLVDPDEDPIKTHRGLGYSLREPS